MYRSVSMIVLVAVVASCGGAQKRPQLSAAIASSWTPTIVTVEAGDAVGPGVVVDATGLIAVPLHIVEGESVIRVKLHQDPTEYPVTLIAGVDKARELALLRIDAKRSLPAVRLGDSSTVSAGDRVVALGIYGVSEGPVTNVVAAPPERTVLEVVLASAQVWSGPLFNDRGEVIGLTVAILPATSRIIAAPANELRQLMQRPVALSPGEFAAQTAKPTPPPP